MNQTSRALQSGFTLVETVASAFLLTVVAGGALAAFLAQAKSTAPQAGFEAAQRAMLRVGTLAEGISKYAPDGTAIVSGVPWNLRMPNPLGSPIPLVVSAVQSGQQLTVTVRYPGSQGTTATLTQTFVLYQKAPPPNFQSAIRGPAP